MAAIELCHSCHHTLPASFYTCAWDGSILRGCSMPSEADRTVIQARIDNVDAELAAIDDELSYHQSLMDTLTARRNQTIKYRSDAKPYISPSPIRRAMLPPEIYRLIFQLSCADLTIFNPNATDKLPTSAAHPAVLDGDLVSASTFLPTHLRNASSLFGPASSPLATRTSGHSVFSWPGPNPVKKLPSPAVKARSMSLTISSVCHHWRQIALEHPDLWSFIRVDAKTQRELVRLYLQRSKSRPLDLEISTSEPSLFEPLLDACRRWKVVHLACEYVHIGELCIFPMLTDLNIKAKRGSRLPSWSRPEQFPVLRKLRIDNSESISNFIDNAHLKIDWPRVSHVVGSPTSPMSFFSNKHLAAVPRVECICDSNPPAVDGNPSLHITSFVLCAPTWEFTGFLSKLPNFRLTRLDNLDLDIPANIPNIGSWFRIFAELLQRSECSITSLSLRRTRITDTEISLQVDDLYILFDACRSSLRCLTIMEGAPSLLTDDFVHNLLSVGHDGEPAYLPSLAQITLVWAERPRAKNYSIVAHSALARNLPLRIGSASTANGVKPLEKVVLGIRNGLSVQPEINSLLADLRKSGVEATLW